MQDKWQALQRSSAQGRGRGRSWSCLRRPGRAQHFSARAGEMLFDYSKTNIDAAGDLRCCWNWPRRRAWRKSARRCLRGDKDQRHRRPGGAAYGAARAGEAWRSWSMARMCMPEVRAIRAPDGRLCPRCAVGGVSGAGRPDHRCGQHRHRRVGPWPGDGDAGAGTLSRRAALHFVSNVDGAHIADTLRG